MYALVESGFALSIFTPGSTPHISACQQASRKVCVSMLTMYPDFTCAGPRRDDKSRCNVTSGADRIERGRGHGGVLQCRYDNFLSVLKGGHFLHSGAFGVPDRGFGGSPLLDKLDDGSAVDEIGLMILDPAADGCATCLYDGNADSRRWLVKKFAEYKQCDALRCHTLSDSPPQEG